MKRGSLSMFVAVLVLAVAALAAVFGSLIASDATVQDVTQATLPPGSPGHLLGTDRLGRDILKLSIAGAGSALIGPVVIALGSLLLGLILGSLAGFFSGWVDTAVSRTTDLLLALPGLLAAIVVIGILGGGYWATVAVFVVLFAPSDIRIVRAAAAQQSQQPYIESARVLGYSGPRILVQELIPNVLPIALTNGLLNFAFALVSMSSLSFLGLGVPPDAADWGRQLADGQKIMNSVPSAVIVPALCIVVVALAANAIGDRLNETVLRRSEAQ